MWRLQATGTAAAVFGERELKRDIGARLHQYRGDLSKELNFYHPRGEAIVGAFVDGVNAYIAETERRPELLPIEFELLGIKPQRWTPAVVISRHQGLFGNVQSEVDNAKIIATIGAERLRKLRYFQGGEPVLTPDAAIDLAAIPENVLELYTAFRRPLSFEPTQIAAPYRNDQQSFTSLAAVTPPISLEPRGNIGSNNWVVHGSRTQSTLPLLANDPHRAVTAPSLRYWVHLVAPGWNVIGGGEPVLPGVSIGHNEYGAWGLTIFGSDVEDLYVYDTDPARPDFYQHGKRWERMTSIQDTIAVKGRAPEAVTYKYTRNGPVLFEDKIRHKVYVLRAAWLEQGNAPYLASLRMNQARSWEEFRAACAHNYAPAEAMVWADRKGNIGYQATGVRVMRPNWSGLLPVPGSGAYEWRGYLPIKSLPSAHNPPSGFIATANNYLMPNDFRWPAAMTYTWEEPYRFERIGELLGSGRSFNVAEVVRMQNDDLSIPARALVPLLDGIPLQGRVAEARDLLLAWDFALSKDSVAAGIYSMWQEQLQKNFSSLIVGANRPRLPEMRVSMKRLIDQLYAPGGEFGVEPLQGRDALLVRSLEEALAQLTDRLGATMSAWHYGQEKHHHAQLIHPLSNAVSKDVRARLDVGLAPRGGDSYTISATGRGRQAVGPSFKIIADVEDWDNSVGLNAPGQSGDTRSPHYRDLFEMWAQGKYFPIAYSRGKVESVTEHRSTLVP